MLPYYDGKSIPKQSNIDFESAEETLMEADKEMIEQRRFERINNAIYSMTYTKYEEIPENKDIFI